MFPEQWKSEVAWKQEAGLTSRRERTSSLEGCRDMAQDKSCKFSLGDGGVEIVKQQPKLGPVMELGG